MQGLAKTAEGVGHIDVITVDKPSIGPDEALVEVAYAGLCGSDLGIYQFEESYDFIEFPRLIGHEYSGRVVETGEQVTTVETGDRVVENPIRACDNCYQCTAGLKNICQNSTITGVHHDGGFAEYVAVPEESLLTIPDDLSLRKAATVEPTSVAGRSIIRNSRISVGDHILVEGPGPIGLLAAQMARAQGGNVVVSGVDIDNSYRLPLAEELGFRTVDVSETRIADVVDSRTDGLGFDVVVDATGHPSGLEAASSAVRKGGQVVLVGQSGHVSLDFTPFIRGEVDVQCSYAADTVDFETSIELLGDGTIDVDPLLGPDYGLHDADTAFKSCMDAEICKPMFDFDLLRK